MNSLLNNRQRGALYGTWISDALAMPVHWYYNREALRRDYGVVDRYLAPRNPHPDSILWRSRYTPASPAADILREQATFWGQTGIHYHQFLDAGENTLNLQLSQILFKSLIEHQGYQQDDYLHRFIATLTERGHHRDTYVEEYLRNYFDQYAQGQNPKACGCKEKHIGGLSLIIPLIVWYAHDPETARRHAHAHLKLTHTGTAMEQAADLTIDLLLAVLNGQPLLEAIQDACSKQHSPFVGHPFEKWLTLPDEMVIGQKLSPACYLEDALPAVIYLARKYHDDPKQALVANTMLGGDNAHRGAVLGALLGAAHGVDGFPEPWRTELRLRPRVRRQLDEVYDAV